MSGQNVRLLENQEGNIPLALAINCSNAAVVHELLQVDGEQQACKVSSINGDTALHIVI
jgi:ankyrin repeat protein